MVPREVKAVGTDSVHGCSIPVRSLEELLPRAKVVPAVNQVE